MNKKGFTLVELLVVIAIISVLTAIIFPVFAKVREKARQASCASNIKQIWTAVSMYISDYDECMMVDYYRTDAQTYPDGSPVVAPNYLWMHMVWPYIKSNAVFDCPNFKEKFTGYGWSYNLDNGMYAMNAWAMCIMDDPPCYKLGKNPYVTLGDIKLPSETPFIADGHYYLMSPETNVYFNNSHPPYPIHNNNMLNMAFVDGHVKFINLNDWIPNSSWSPTSTDPVWLKWDPMLQR